MKRNSVRRLGFALLLAACWWSATSMALAQTTGTRRSTTSSTTRRSTSGGGGSSGTRDYLNNTMVGEASVTSDPETRRLIVITDDETALSVSNVVANLDRPKPQVLIKVVFLEVAYRNNSDIGVEGAYKKVFDTSMTGIVQQVFGLADQGASPFPPGAGIYTIMGKDFAVTIRAIAQAGKAEILSRPSVMARNNQQAVIMIGQQVPLVTNTRFDNNGNQINTVAYTDVGIILRVTPFIGAEGMVEMIVAPEISELADKTQWVPTGSGALAPTIDSRSANTVVVTPNGQPVVIGGLMAKSRRKAVSKIPFLGDIPYLGAAFRRTIQDDVKTELMIFLTPYIVRDPVELAALTEREKNSHLVLPSESQTEQDLNRFLDTLPTAEPDQPGKKKKAKDTW